MRAIISFFKIIFQLHTPADLVRGKSSQRFQQERYQPGQKAQEGVALDVGPLTGESGARFPSWGTIISRRERERGHRQGKGGQRRGSAKVQKGDRKSHSAGASIYLSLAQARAHRMILTLSACLEDVG